MILVRHTGNRKLTTKTESTDRCPVASLLSFHCSLPINNSYPCILTSTFEKCQTTLRYLYFLKVPTFFVAGISMEYVQICADDMVVFSIDVLFTVYI
jgi:hypothetical protein